MPRLFCIIFEKLSIYVRLYLTKSTTFFSNCCRCYREFSPCFFVHPLHWLVQLLKAIKTKSTHVGVVTTLPGVKGESFASKKSSSPSELEYDMSGTAKDVAVPKRGKKIKKYEKFTCFLKKKKISIWIYFSYKYSGAQINLSLIELMF